MERSLVLLSTFLLATSAASAQSSTEAGQPIFATYCASCHGAQGAGLIGPNLTDAEILHGDSLAEIQAVVTKGVPSKAMPAWESVLSANEIESVSLYVKSIMGLNLQGPAQRKESTVTPFPEGTADRPYLIRTFMPTLGIEDSVFAHHGVGEATPKYDPKSGTFSEERVDDPIDGVPGAIAVSFGPELSYCFDTTECRLLYTWQGGFLDMTDYWGAGEGGGRKRFGYIPTILGSVEYKTSGEAMLSGQPKFKGYRKDRGIPVLLYSIGDKDIELSVSPGAKPGVAKCHFKISGATSSSVKLRLPNSETGTWTWDKGVRDGQFLDLSADEARSFTLTLSPNAK